jgi:heme exporter protein A
VKGDLTAAENLSITCTLAGLRIPQGELHAALERFGLPVRKIPLRNLSQGQRRRAALARLCVSAAIPLWLLDEPFSALDADGIELLRSLVLAQLQRGGAVVFTTHQDPGIAATHRVDLG